MYVCVCGGWGGGGEGEGGSEIIDMDTVSPYLGRVKRKLAIEHELNMRIHTILSLREVPSGHLLSTFFVSNDSICRKQRP